MSVKGQPMNLTIKSISALLLVGSLSACGGGSVSNEKAQEVIGQDFNVSAYDINGDGQPSPNTPPSLIHISEPTRPY